MPLQTILLDMDDTLLESNMDTFIQNYMAGLGAALQDFVSPANFQPALMTALGAMQANQNPQLSNHQAFYNAFLPHLAGSAADINAAIDRFYREFYPTLQPLTRPIPAARQLIRWLLASGYQVVIATNPIFPETAITQRLAWAEVDDFPYARITTMQNSHFSKPNPAYYHEILTQLQATPPTTLMVGDHLENDIIPAKSLGLQTWWVTAQAKPAPQADRQGSLAGLLAWLQTAQ